MPQRSANICDCLLANGRPEDIAVIDRTGRHTYRELHGAVAAVSQEIGTWRLSSGARIGLLSRNSLFWVAAYLAILGTGHIAVPFATALTAEDIRRKAQFVGCGALLIDSALAGKYGAVLSETDHVADESLLEGHGAVGRFEPVPVAADADAVLMFTSGTTATPRAVRVTHQNLRTNTNSIIDYLELTSADRVLAVLPFSYCYGASLLHTHLRAGGGISICDTFAYPETVIDAIRQDKCTGIAGVPSTYQLLLRASSFEHASLPTLRCMQQAGGRLPQPQIERVAAAQPHAQLFVMYGQTEATSRLSYLPPTLLTARRGSIGRGIPGVSLTVVDAEGNILPAGAVGEVFAQGANITKGYWNDPAGTAAKFVDGGLRTGDLARADEDGFIYIVDRQDDFIKSWGFRVSSHEVEDAVVAVPGVAGAAAVGRPDERAGEAIVVFYVPVSGREVTADQILAHCREVLAGHLVPHEVHRIDELPLNQNGKIVKAALKALAATY